MRLRWLGPLLLGVACHSSSDTGGEPPPPAQVSFPAGFMWGSASAGFQVEKGDVHTDWWHWSQTPGKIKNGDQPDVNGPDAFAHVDEDVAALTSSGQNAYRLSIEWGRVYPTRADFDADTPDPAAIALYEGLFAKLRAAGIKPLVTMIHYSLPDWLDDISNAVEPQGFELATTAKDVGTWCGRMAKHFGADVDWWATLNEPTLPPLSGYIAGRHPPGLVLEAARAFASLKNEALAHVACYDAIHANDAADADGDGKAAWVSLVNQSRVIEPVDPSDPDDVAAAQKLEFVNNLWFWRVAVNGDWDDDLDGKYDGPNDRTGDATLKGRADYVGLNYYSAAQASARKGIVIPILNVAAPVLDHLNTTRPKTDAGLDIYPEGFKLVLDEIGQFHLPVVITENGVADANDTNRARFLLEHLYQVGWAMQRGMDVRGFFEWSLVDNFEWDSGYCPKFGWQSYDPATGARHPRPSLQTYKTVIQSGTMTKAQIDAMPAYAPPAPCP